MFLNYARRLKCFFHPVKPEETCNSAHKQTSLSNDTIDFVLRERELGRGKEISENSRIHSGRRIKRYMPTVTV